MIVSVRILPSSGNNREELALYDRILQHYVQLLAEQGILAIVKCYQSAEIDPLEPTHRIEIETDDKRKLYPILRRLPGAYDVFSLKRRGIAMRITLHEPESAEGKALSRVICNFDRVDASVMLDDKRLLLYMIDGSSVVITVASVTWQQP